jgi:ubiquinone/menaquinone biosynthesis C-methylase UbiE
MGWLNLPRVPEPEIMDSADEVEAYASATAQKYLDALDDTLVEQVFQLPQNGKAASGRLLDIGCGPGSIALKIARRSGSLLVTGVDRSDEMVAVAQRAAATQGLASRASFLVADGNHLSFPDATFDFVLSNSVLHHLQDPVAVFNEMARLSKPGGVILVRDLRRPSRLFFPLHVRWHGRYYSGLMKQLYVQSVRAAYTPEELAELLRRSRLGDSLIFYHGRTHFGFIRKSQDATAAEVSKR